MADLKYIYKELKAKTEEIERKKEAIKSSLELTRESLADIFGYFDEKNNVPDVKRIKSGLLVKAIEFYETDKNKLEEDLDTMLDYYKKIKNREVEKENIDLYIETKESLKESKSEFNELKKKFEEKVDPIEIKIIMMIITEGLSDTGRKLTDDDFVRKVEEIKNIIYN